MKKKIISLVFLLFAVVSVAISVCAEETMKKEDSLIINENIKKKLGIYEFGNIQSATQQSKTVKNVMRIYNVGIRFAFLDYSNIEDILKSNEILEEYYIIIFQDDSLAFKRCYNEEIYEVDEYGFNRKAFNAFWNDGIIKKISPDIEVNNIYYLSGETNRMGTAIYYETNKGDFVYYNYYELGDGEYLFPVEDFCRYQKAISAEKRKYADQDGAINIRGLWDLSKYDINSSTFDLSAENTAEETGKTGGSLLLAGIIFGGCVLAAGIILSFVRLYRKKKNKA